MDLTKILAVGFGGFIGSIIRFLITNNVKSVSFPYATLVANFMGCFIIGALMFYFSYKSENTNLKLFLVTGIMGGLTTFSTFSYETFNLMKNDEILKAFTNIFVSFSGCLLLTFLGFKISSLFIK